MGNQLPANVGDFVKKAQQHRRSAAFGSGDKAFLKFSGKSGEWLLGKEEDDVKNEIAVINVLATQHGFVRWGEKPPAKVFTPITQPLPTPPENIDGTDPNTGHPRTFTPQDARKLEGKFMDDELGEFIFDTNSMGGVERVDELIDEVMARAGSGSAYIFPKVNLTGDFYKRPDGKVHKPIFEIEAWCNMEGVEEGEPVPELEQQDEPEPKQDEPEPEAKPARRRRRK